ncbi:ABC transporter domain-containing protein [Fusarium sp. LHS14.1]|nr:ABC transporter domain-containing protein [Fusarium sp. LHS14.1]
MCDLRPPLEVFQVILGAASYLYFLVGIQFKQFKAQRRERIPFIIVLCATLLVVLADISILFVSTGWMPNFSPLFAVILYMLALSWQIDHLWPCSDKEKGTEPTWHAYFGSWAAMFVFDVVAIIKLVFASRSLTPDLVCAGVRCGFKVILLVLSVRPYMQLPRDWRKWLCNESVQLPDDGERTRLLDDNNDDNKLPDDEKRTQLPIDGNDDNDDNDDNEELEGVTMEPIEQSALRHSVSDEIIAAGGLGPWLKRFRIFWPWIWPSRAPMARLRIVASLGLQLVYTGLTLASPRVYSAFVESLAQIYGDEESDLVWLRLLAYSAVLLSLYGIYTLKDMLQDRIKLDRRSLASTSIYQHLMRHEASFHLQTNSIDINMAIEDGISACETFDFITWELLPQIITVIITEITILSLFGLHTGLVQVAVVAVDTLFVLRLNRKQMPMYDARTTARQETKRRREGGLKAWVTVFLFGQVDREINDYATLLRSETTLDQKILDSSFRFNFASNIIVTAGTLFAIGLGIQYGLQTGGDFGSVVMLMNYWHLVQGPLKSFMRFPGRLNQKLIAADRFRRLLETETKMEYGKAVLREVEGGIRLQNLSFSYPSANGKGKSVFKHLTLSIAPGETVAFAGPTGVGKSTLFSLITRLFDPDEGSIEIGGQDIRTLQKGELIEHMAVMNQEPYIFDGTIRSNIKYGKDGATDAEMHVAARMAGIHDDIMALEKQYDAKISEGGRNLSGGQKQRVALARVFIRDAPIVLLDEATSAVDADTEAHIKNSVKNGTKTTLLIAYVFLFSLLFSSKRIMVLIMQRFLCRHRLSSIADADRIVILGKGEDGCGVIVEEGTHERLKALKGVYAQLWKNNTDEKNIEQIFAE